VDERTLRLLEYRRLLEEAARRARTALGAAQLLSLEPSTDAQVVAQRLALAAEAGRLVGEASDLLVGVEDVGPAVRRAARGGVLAAEDLFRLLVTLEGLRRTRQAVLARAEDVPRLADLAERITPEPALEGEIRRAVDDNGVKDQASPELARLRSELRRLENQVRETLDGYLRDRGLHKYLQEALVTQRNGRWVLPVKMEFRHQIPGIVHDVSASGATAFVEPAVIVRLQNEAERLRALEAQEVERILRALSARVAGRAPAIETSLAAAATLDAYLARAELGRAWGGVVPEVGGEEIRIVRGRHPLLYERAVPLDLVLAAPRRALIITGPNTGGKTVALKTVGLFACLAQSGFWLPAAEGTRLPLFDGIFADIGDEQSIEQNLSTFSSHMGAIAGILAKAGPNALVLLDELGAGTDPEEGAALALAIVEALLERRSRLIATTHYGALKELALSDPRVENASVEFDVETLRPTYRLVQGRPGQSHALVIAERLGVPPSVLASARRHLGRERVTLAELLAQAEAESRRLAALRAEGEAAAAEAERLRSELEARLAAARRREAETLEAARREARALVQQAKAELRRLIQEARRRAAEEGMAALEAVRAEVRAWDERTLPAEGARPAAPPGGEAAQVGDHVEIVSLGQTGRLLERRQDTGVVEVGMLRLTVPLADLRPVAAPRPVGGSGWLVSGPEPTSVRPEVDLRGLEAEEAVALLEKYLDDCLLAGLGEVRVIHGKGTGALRRAVHEYLRRHPAVSSFRLGAYGEGEDGVTVVRLGRDR
jgi:DNA mismatch repair protein MutS2